MAQEEQLEVKPNELMIGDWVVCKKWRENPFKLTRINDSGRFCYGITSNGTQVEPFLLEEIEPIPLTVEILEKNGFHKEWDEDIILMVCDTIIVEIGDKHTLYKDGKMYLRRVLSPLYYVHELQHALRLCRIEKEIIL